MCLRLISKSVRHSENGNVFMAIFGAIALVGLLGASIMTFMKGPLSTSVKLTKMNTAQNQMSIGAQVAVMATASQANHGDCELIDPDGAGPLPAAGDGFVEPIPFRSPTTEPVPVGGGLVPLTLGISKKDPWSTEYGYCVWNHGPSTAANGCDANMLAGTNSSSYSVVALISAGPDKAFTTTCRDFATADVNSDGDLLDTTDLPLASKAAETDDDIITTFTYEEATGASGGLWSLKAGEPGTAVIGKNIEATGIADLKGGVLLPDKSFIDCTDVANTGVMAKSTLGIEICDGAGAWTSIGGASGALSTSATCAAPADAGNVRFNSVSGQPEFCNGTTWLPFSINTPGVNLVITPNNNNALNVNGASNQDTVRCTVANNLTCGSPVIFTVTNQGTMTSAITVIQIVQPINGINTTFSAAALAIATNASNFVITANTCTTTLAVNATCTVTIEPKASGNTSYTATLRVNSNNIPLAIISGVSTNFGCTPGRIGGGGVYAYCGLTEPTTGETYDLVVQPGGCTGSTNNPTCAGGTDTVTKISTSGCCSATQIGGFYGYVGNETNGARNSATIMKMSAAGFGAFPGVQYCRQMNYNGYTDWYLPARQEYISYIYPNRVAIGGFQNTYITSLLGTNYDVGYSNLIDGGSGGTSASSAYYVRCARRENIALPTIPTLNTPSNLSVVPGVTFIPGERMSFTRVVNGILDPMAVSISGAVGNPTFRVNGGAEVTSATVTNGASVQFLMDAPTVLGTKNNATISWGPVQSAPWWTGYADSTRVAKGFVTSGTMRANLGGLSGADAICNTYAASSPYGLSGSWKAIMADSTTSASAHIPWSWGILQSVTGATIVDGGIADFFDGTFDDFFNVTQSGAVSTSIIWTGSDQYGASYNANGSTSGYFAFDWTSSNCCNSGNVGTYGQAGSKSTTGLNYGSTNADNYAAIRCIENIDGTVDTIPSPISLSYVLQAALSSRQASPVINIGGMSAGATTTLSVTATGGDPKFTINGGAEVSSGSVQNGDSIMFLMDAPATASSSYKMTITSTAGASTVLGYWRVWSGWDGLGTGIKRVFVTSTDPSGSSFGGVAGADPVCQARSVAAGLGGTWKAILSGLAETEWAVNRVGYNWNELRLVDGTTVVAYAPNLWATLLNPVVKTEFGVARSAVRVLSGTAANGNSYSSVSDLSNLFNWTGAQCSATYMQGNSSALTVGISQGYWLCQSDGALFCIEQ